MSNPLLDAIDDGVKSNKPLIWLDAEAYGSKVVLSGKPFPWTDTTAFVGSYGQLHSLLKPGVAPVHLDRFFAAWLSANPAALAEMQGKKRIRFALRKLLGMDAPRDRVREIVSALCASLSQPVVLVLPPNGELINWANQAANGAPAAEITEVDIDAVSVYLADMVRAFGGLDVAGVLVQLPDGTAVDAQLLALYSPIINLAGHYHWAFGVQVSTAPELSDAEEKIDFAITDRCTGQLAAPQARVLGDEFWENGQHGPSEDGFFYARVPENVTPEVVLARLHDLR